MAHEPALYGHDKDPSDTSVHQTDSGSGDKGGSFAFDPLIWWWLYGDSQLILITIPACVTCSWDKGGCGRHHNHPLALTRAWMWNALISFWSQWLLGRSEMLWAWFQMLCEEACSAPSAGEDHGQEPRRFMGTDVEHHLHQWFTSSPLWWIRLKLSACVVAFRCETLICITVVLSDTVVIF